MADRIGHGLLAVMLFTTACATEPAGTPPVGARALSAVELHKLIQGSAASGRLFDDDNDQGLTFAFRADGRMAVTSRFFKTRTIEGSWRIDAAEARLCTRIEADDENCSRVYRLPIEAEGYYVDVEGGTQRANTFRPR